ncbi:MAG: GNAT family N-acetyltransferase [Gillisia sp.]
MRDFESFTTERLLLIPTSEKDADFILKLLNTPKWLKFIGDRNVKTTPDAVQYIRNKITPQFQKSGYGAYTVVRKSDGAKMGNCGLYDREGLEGVDIGFAFLPEFEGKGYAFEAASKIKELAEAHFKIKELKAISVKENTASQKLLKKLGFKSKGTIDFFGEELLLFQL